MNNEFTQQVFQYDEDYGPWDEYDPVAQLENQQENELLANKKAEIIDLDKVTNDDFLKTIFGNSFSTSYPLVCAKSGDPGLGGWQPQKWPCQTNDETKNWYCLPSQYAADDKHKF